MYKPKPFTIPDVPAGIIDPNNLYHKDYGDRALLTWWNEDFHSRLAWISRRVQSFSNLKMQIARWYTDINSEVYPALPRPVSTHFVVELGGASVAVDVRNVMDRPDLVVSAILSAAGLAVPPAPFPYPGYRACNPPDFPVGPAIEPSPWPVTLYQAAPDSANYQVGEDWWDESGIYTLRGLVGPIPRAWEKVYRR